MTPMSPATARLMADIDSLPWRARMRLLADRARNLAPDELGPLLADLYAGDRFRREIALFMAIVAGHRPVLDAARDDPVWTVRRAAIGAWLGSGQVPAAEIAVFADGAPWHDRRYVYRMLRKTRQTQVADALIDRVWRRFGDAEAARLLPACSAATLARLLPELSYPLGNWRGLAGRHPDLLLDVAGTQLAELAPPDRDRWWARFGSGVLAAAPPAATRVLDLLDRYGPAGHLPGPLRYYGALADADPGRVIALLSAPSRTRWLEWTRLPRPLLRRLARLDPAALAPLAERLRGNETALVALLRALPPSRRAVLFTAAYAGIDRAQAMPSDPMLEVLPRVLRAAEATRMLALPAVAADADLAVHYTAFLPWDQACRPLREAASRARAEDRARGYELLVGCAARTADPGIVTEVIEYLPRIRNEQDPVRSRVLAALAAISPDLFEAGAAAPLTRLVTDALSARDGSVQTRHAVTSLAVRMLGRRTDVPPLLAWSLATLEQIWEDRLPALGRLDLQLRRGQELDVYAAVRRRLEAGVRRGSYEALFATVRALGRRAWHIEPLQNMLRRAVSDGNVAPVVRDGIVLWLADPAARSERVQHVLRTDSSAVALREVWRVLCLDRTDLLDRVLIGKAPAGKFLAAGLRWVPDWAPRADRWLPRHQGAYARLLGKQAADAGAKTHTRTRAIANAARLGDAGWDVVSQYPDSASVNLAEAALAALAWTDRPADALAILLGHSGDDRARVAMYAAGRAARFLRPAQLLPVLTAGLAGGKVTSRKELVRLIAALRLPGAGEILGQEWARGGPHRDVRAAIASAARQRLHDPLSWPILDEAAAGTPEEALAVVSSGSVFDCAPRFRRRYAGLVAVTCGSEDQAVATTAWAALAGWLAWAPDAGAMVTTRITDLPDIARWRLGLPVMRAMLAAGRAGPVLGQTVSRLAELDRADDGSDPLRDRPARQRLTRVIDAAAEWAAGAPLDLDRSPLADAAHALVGQSDMTIPAARLLLAAVRFDDRPTGSLGEICSLVASEPVAATYLAGQLMRRVAEDTWADPEFILAAAVELGQDGGLAAGLLAAALTSYGHRLGWPEEWRSQLRRLRGHELADVRMVALEIVMAAELTRPFFDTGRGTWSGQIPPGPLVPGPLVPGPLVPGPLPPPWARQAFAPFSRP
jgi:hypothetical protein